MQIKKSLDHEIVLDLSIGISTFLSGVWKTLVTLEHKVTYGDLVVTSLGKDFLAIVKDVYSEVFRYHTLNISELFTTLKQLDVYGSTGVISWGYEDLFLEDDSILSWDIAINILLWLA